MEQGGLATTKRTVLRGRASNKIHHKWIQEIKLLYRK